MSNTITPFWNRIPKIYLYGIHPNALAIIGILLVASYLFGGPLLNIVFYIVAVKYSSEALQHTQRGELVPPRLNFEIINNNYELPFKLFIVIFCYFYLIDTIAYTAGGFLAILMTFASLLLLPAVIISFVVTEQILYAINPVNWLNIPLRIGWPYLIMVLFLFLLEIVELEFTGFVLNHLPGSLVNPFWVGLRTYFMIITFHLMGYVVMQYHEALGTQAPDDGADSEPGTENSAHSSPLLEKFIDEGNIEAAIAELSSIIHQNPGDLELRRKMYMFLRSNGQTEKLKHYAPHYFGLLSEGRRYSDAANVYLESLQQGNAFYPEASGHYLPVLRELRARRANKPAIMLTRGFHKRFPDDPNTPALYLETAKILSEELQRDDLAQQALRFILKKFPNDELIPSIKQYLALISQLQGESAAS